MAEVKVSALTALTGANVANGDELYIVDTGSPNVSKKITADELAQMPQLSSRYAPLPGAWTAWTPSVTSSTGTITTVGTVEGRYVKMGRFVHCNFSVTITTKGTAAGALEMTIPVTASTAGPNATAVGTYREGANTGVMGVVMNAGASLVEMRRYDNTTPFQTDGDLFRGSFTYEAAS